MILARIADGAVWWLLTYFRVAVTLMVVLAAVTIDYFLLSLPTVLFGVLMGTMIGFYIVEALESKDG